MLISVKDDPRKWDNFRLKKIALFKLSVNRTKYSINVIHICAQFGPTLSRIQCVLAQKKN